MKTTAWLGRFGILGVGLSLALVPATSLADGDRDHGDHGDHGDRDHGDHGDHGDKGDKGDKGDHDDDQGDDRDDAPDAAPLPPPPGLTPTQTDFRQKLVGREHDAVDKFAHRNGKHISQEDRVLIGEHYRHVMRLLRIRELAEQAKDTASVAKCDDLLAKADKWLQNHAKGGAAPTPATTSSDGGGK